VESGLCLPEAERAGRPKSFSAGPTAPLDLAFLWISITGKEMLTEEKKVLNPFGTMNKIKANLFLEEIGKVQIKHRGQGGHGQC